MGQKIRLNEEQLKRIIAESVKKILAESMNEISPEFLAKKAKRAKRSLNGPFGKLKGIKDPEWMEKKQKQLSKIEDYSKDHPDDEWDEIDTTFLLDDEPWSGAADRCSPDTRRCTFKNKRTGEVRTDRFNEYDFCHNPSKLTVLLRGKVNPKYGGRNDERFRQMKRKD